MNRPFGDDPVRWPKPIYSDDRQWVLAGKAADIPQGKAVVIALPHFRIAVFHIEDKFYAIKDACPHAEYPLSKGTVCEGIVTCASHNWKFNLKTGEGVKGEPATDIRTFEISVRNEEVWVKIN